MIGIGTVMIRISLVGIFLLIYFILSLIVLPVEWLIGKVSKKARDYSCFYMVRGAFKVVLLISGTKVNIKGLENLPKNQAVLYVANHRSFFDIVIAYSLVPPLTGFVSKKEVKKIPLLSHWMVLMNCLFLDRDNIKEGLKTILQGIENVKKGISVFIFPEGTRSKTDDGLQSFKEGSLKIAEKTNCPIIPVAFSNTSAAFEDQFPKIKKANVTVEFGQPIHVSELSKDEKKFIGAYAHDKIEEMLKNNK